MTYFKYTGRSYFMNSLAGVYNIDDIIDGNAGLCNAGR